MPALLLWAGIEMYVVYVNFSDCLCLRVSTVAETDASLKLLLV